MHISDLVGQYNKAGSQAEPITKTKGVERLVSSVSELTKGNIFEGTVNSVKGGQVRLGLSNGTQITARLSGKISLQPGQSMFFQVKSNNGATVEIRPFTIDGNGANLTLLEALKAAGLSTDKNNITMVNHMMQEQMSIDRNSLSDMARVLQNNPDVNVTTLVEMTKLGLDISPQMASQYENYMQDKQAINNSMNEFIDALPELLSNENMEGNEIANMGSDILSIVTDGLTESMEPIEPQTYGPHAFENGTESQAMSDGTEIKLDVVINDGTYVTDENIVDGKGTFKLNGENPVNMEADNAETSNAVTTNAEVVSAETANTEVTGAEVKNVETANIEAANTEVANEEVADAKGTVSDNEPKVILQNSLETVFSEKEISNLSELVKKLIPEERQENFVELKKDKSDVSTLNDINKLLAQNPNADKNDLLALFSSKEFGKLLKNVMERQWTVKPKEIADSPDKMSKLYEKIERQLDRLENIVKATGQTNEHVSNLASNIKSNIEFMNQINEAYTYVQLPLKMSGQNASGQLYVYTNKKKINDPEQELSAFLHLDMDNLGATDVSVKLLKKNVDTNFYFDNDASYNLVKQFLPQLEERLKAKGYNCKLNVINEGNSVNFVNDFLKKDMPGGGQLHRYSFDMRA